MMLDKVCINTFLTPGFMGWGELFLEGLRYLHGEQIYVRIDSRNLSEFEIEQLHSIYGNLEVHNSHLDFELIAKKLGVSLEKFHKWRVEIERGIANSENHLFRIAISVDERYRSLSRVANKLRAQGYELMLHSDADIYIRKPLNRVFEIIKDHDVSLFIRHNNPHRLAVVGGFLGFNLNDDTSTFMERWMHKIDEVPSRERWKGYGQSVLWYTVQESDDIKIADFSTIPDAPKYTKLFDSEKELWLGNSKVKGPVKVVSIRRCWDDLLAKYPRIPLPKRTIKERVFTEIKSMIVFIKVQLSGFLRRVWN